MMSQYASMSKLDLGDPKYYLVDTNFIIDIGDANHVDWVAKMIPKGSIFLVLESVRAESKRTFENIKEIFAPFKINVERIAFDDPVILKQYQFFQKDFSYALPDKVLSKQDMQILAVTAVHQNLKIITNDGQLQYAIMDSRTKDLRGDIIPEKEYVEGLILDHRKFGFSKGDMYDSYANLLFRARYYHDVIRTCREGIDYLERLRPKDPDANPLIPYDSEVTRNTRELLLRHLGWTYVKIGTSEELLDVAQQIMEIDTESEYAEKFFDVSRERMNKPAPTVPTPAPTPKSRKRSMLETLDRVARDQMKRQAVNTAVYDPWGLRKMGRDHLEAVFGKDAVDMDGNPLPVFPVLPIPDGAGAGADAATEAVGAALDIG